MAALFEKENPTEREQKIIFAVTKGQKTESTIRNYINETYNMDFQPIVLLSDDDSRFSASLDGFEKIVIVC